MVIGENSTVLIHSDFDTNLIRIEVRIIYKDLSAWTQVEGPAITHELKMKKVWDGIIIKMIASTRSSRINQSA